MHLGADSCSWANLKGREQTWDPGKYIAVRRKSFAKAFPRLWSATMESIMAIAGLALGIFALVYAFVPDLSLFLSMPCAVVGFVLSTIGFYNSRRRKKRV